MDKGEKKESRFRTVLMGTPFGINPFGIRVEFREPHSLTPEETRRALISAIEMIPEQKLKDFSNGRLTLLV